MVITRREGWRRDHQGAEGGDDEEGGEVAEAGHWAAPQVEATLARRFAMPRGVKRIAP